MGADVLVNDPDTLLAFLDARLPAAGARNWGVGLKRLGDRLVIAPAGDLDERSVRKLRQVVESRAGSYKALVIDTRDVASATAGGTAALLRWPHTPGGDGTGRRLLPGERVEAALAGAGLDSRHLAGPDDAGTP